MLQKINYYDEHVHLRPHHTPPPSHRLAPMVEEAGEKGIEIGVREHAPLPEAFRLGPRKDYYFAMAPEEVEAFLNQFRGRPVRLGLEVDFFPEAFEEIKAGVEAILLRARQMEIPIAALHGAVHLLPGNIDDIPDRPAGFGWVMWDDTETHFRQLLEARGVPQLIEDYHDLLAAMIQTEYFQVVAHLELIRKFDRTDERGNSIYFAPYENLYEEAMFDVLALAARHGTAVEINTQGIDRPLGRPFLSPKMVAYCVQKHIPICFGSDAHQPHEIGRYFDRAARMFVEAGGKKPVYFVNQKPEYWTLPA